MGSMLVSGHFLMCLVVFSGELLEWRALRDFLMYVLSMWFFSGFVAQRI